MKRLRIGILLLLVFLFLSSYFLPFSALFDEKSLDIFRRPHSPHPDIVILAIDNKSLTALGRWPWSRTVHAQILDKLQAYNPQVVAYDVTFSEIETKQADTAFAQSLSRSNFPVVLAAQAVFEKGKKTPSKIVMPQSILAKNPNVLLGNTNVFLSEDGLVRRFPKELFFANQTLLPLSFQVARVLHASTPENDSQLISFAGPSGTFQTFSLSDVLSGSVPREKLSEKLILIGATASDLRDTLLVPGTRQILSGVEYHANIIDNLLLQRSIQQVPFIISFLFGCLLFLLFIFLFLNVSAQTTLAASVLVLALLPLISFIAWQEGFAFSYSSNLLFSAGFLLIHGLYRWYTTEKEKRRIKTSLQNYFSPQILHHILLHPESLSLGGKRANVTILFSDIRNFTKISEQLSPEILTSLLNEYFTEMTEEILATDGVVDKFIGDAIMAFWGAPIEQKDQADRAVKAAKGMLRRLKVLQKKWEVLGYPKIAIGVGVHTGSATIGNMGSSKRFDYTIIGDDVNLASRIESMNKTYGTSILISENTKKDLSQAEEFKFVDSVIVRGKSIAIRLYTLQKVT